jgi:hypothetical protein
MATFHAPPWCPPPTTTFLRLIMMGAFAFALISPPFHSPEVTDSGFSDSVLLTFQNQIKGLADATFRPVRKTRPDHSQRHA